MEIYEKVSTNLNFVEREKATRAFWEANKIFEKSIDIREGGENYTYRGEPVTCDLKVCHIPMESFLIELHQPIGGPSSFQEFLDKHGEGVHHLGFEVGDMRDRIIDEMAKDGYNVNRTLGIYPGSSWTIVDSESELGVNLNIKPVR